MNQASVLALGLLVLPWARATEESSSAQVQTVPGEQATAPRSTLRTDVEYGQAGGERLLLDVSVPEGPGPFPLAILIHGGGWSAGDKRGADKPGSGADITPWFEPLTEAKFTWFSINYRHAPKHRWPACLEDVKTAIRWVKAHAGEFKGDPSRVALYGHSAGGHLATLAATLVDDTVRVGAVVGFAPVTNHEQDLGIRGGLSPSLQALLDRPKEVTPESLGLLRAISPLNHVRPGLPPFLLIHGDADKTAPIQQSTDFQARLVKNGVRADLIVVPGAGHRLTEWSQFMPDHGARVIRWLRDTLGGGGAGATAAIPLRWGALLLRQKSEWYASPEARAMADNVLRYQAIHGAWPKNTDLTKPPQSLEALEAIHRSGEANTIDNEATTLPMRFFALMTQATGDARYKAAFHRGLEYLFTAQYANGGWPQFFPLREGYYSHITFNDNAMVNVLTLLRDIAAGGAPLDFVGGDSRARASAAVARGIDSILRTQLKQGGKLAGWCAQYDEKTLKPAWARAYEPPSLSGNETVGILRFLMEIKQPGPEVIAAIEGGVSWLRSVAISGLRPDDSPGPDGKRDRRVVADNDAPPLWARFYELDTHRPIFLGRDSVVHYALAEIEYERRNGYAYYGTWPAALLAQDYPRWREKHSRP